MSRFLVPLNYTRAKDVLRKLSGYIRYTPQGAADAAALLEASYPLVFARTEKRPFANGALLLELDGAAVTEPLVFLGHLDAPATAPQPEDGPQSAALSRAHAVSLLEALETLLADGYRPGGDLFIALSMDGLTGGEGAREMAAYLQKRAVKPCFVLDQGGYVTQAAFRTFLPKDAPLALVGTTEKGLLQGELTVDRQALRSDRKRPLHYLMRYGARLTRGARRARLCPASEEMLKAISRRAPLFRRLVLACPRLTFPLLGLYWHKRAIMRQFFESELLATALDTEYDHSAAPVSAELAFVKATVPGRPVAKHRQAMERRLRGARARLRFDTALDASEKSEASGSAWEALGTAIEILFERSVIVPCLSPYITDGRFYTALNHNVYRFSPFLLSGEEALRGECSVTDGSLQTAVQFFRQMLSV